MVRFGLFRNGSLRRFRERGEERRRELLSDRLHRLRLGFRDRHGHRSRHRLPRHLFRRVPGRDSGHAHRFQGIRILERGLFGKRRDLRRFERESRLDAFRLRVVFRSDGGRIDGGRRRCRVSPEAERDEREELGRIRNKQYSSSLD
jgi:hypothetical protein